ncbi:MAG TPA: hypothetical protein PKZ84_11570 [Anaerolineae bacterium]|nr:hypothetical protein [Anaerolineae bacterium]
MNDTVLFDEHTFDEITDIIQKLDEQAVVSPAMRRKFTNATKEWEASIQKTTAQLQQLLELANQLPQHATDAPLVTFAQTLEGITAHFDAFEQSFQQDVEKLKQSLAHLQQRRNQRQTLVLAAQQFSLAEIRNEQQRAKQELESLNLFEFDRSQQELVQIRAEIGTLVETLQQREAQYNAQQQALEALGMKEEELKSREVSIQKALTTYEAQDRLRNLRLSCLEKAREIQRLREDLQQQIGQN